jgi:SAM-dependent methyltransferase
VTSHNRKPRPLDATRVRDAALSSWWSGSRGSGLLAAESELLGEALEDVFGWELLQIGAWGTSRELLGGSRTRRQTVVAPPEFGAGADVIARAANLPINSDSMDAVLLPHTLEFATDPYAIVREVDRVLTGEGQLLVLGFAPWSPWGLRARFSRAGFPPGMRRLLSEKRVRDWLVLLGYEVVASRHYLFASPWGSGPAPGQGTGRYLRRGLNPFPAGAYLLKARKRVYTLTPVRPRFREKPAVIGGLVKPTTRSPSS